MSIADDKMHCVKSLMQLMCCDRDIADREKKFLAGVARELEVAVADWNELLRQVMADPGKLYPIQNRERAIATLQSLVVMAKADKRLDEREKEYLLRFAKSIGVTPQQWRRITRQIDVEHLFDPFKDVKVGGSIMVLKDHFDKLDAFTEVARNSAIATRIVGFDEFISGEHAGDEVVCFHAAPDVEETKQRCKQVLGKSGDKTVSVLTRFQGHQVKYLLEMGLGRCVIEPVYAKDLHDMLKSTL